MPVQVLPWYLGTLAYEHLDNGVNEVKFGCNFNDYAINVIEKLTVLQPEKNNIFIFNHTCN